MRFGPGYKWIRTFSAQDLPYTCLNSTVFYPSTNYIFYEIKKINFAAAHEIFTNYTWEASTWKMSVAAAHEMSTNHLWEASTNPNNEINFADIVD